MEFPLQMQGGEQGIHVPLFPKYPLAQWQSSALPAIASVYFVSKQFERRIYETGVSILWALYSSGRNRTGGTIVLSSARIRSAC